MCRWQVEDGDVEVVHKVQVRHHLFFYQQAFAEAVGVAAAAMAQASVACHSPNPGGPDDHHQLAENSCVSYHETHT